MLVHTNGGYESGNWHTPERYLDQTVYIVDESTAEGAALAAKVAATQPCSLVIKKGALVDVKPRAKTPEEIAAIPKSPEQERIERLEALVESLINGGEAK